MVVEQFYFGILYGWVALAVLIFPVLLKITVPYGRHTTNTWGPVLNSRLGWILMEVPVVVVFSWFLFTGPAEKTLPVYIFYGLFMLHYFNRIFVFPFRLKEKEKKMPWSIVFMALFFNLINGFLNGYWFGWLTPVYPLSWLADWRFIFGVLLFFAGMYINMSSDNTLLGLRKGGKRGYYIPYGGLFNYVSSPNLLGEIIEWMGWAMMSWCLPSFSFALWTMANLIPRAIDHHRWYKRKFNNYPEERKAVIPFVI
ncbi:MAG TPA: 3-oxo-5-alpha-steroid 4-dehydrogenase [Bacteroidetes bacterium]|nr:3-oxo-5-alpha-steroid 4-dehydrogenase [Bacteroidota bacterium]